MTKSIYDVWKSYERLFDTHGIERYVAEQMVREVLNFSFTEWTLRLHDDFPKEKEHLLKSFSQRLIDGEPFQYIAKQVEFFGRTYYVDRRVLIPRPETEEMVDFTLNWLKEKGDFQARIVDIGTGSGVIAITLQLECPSLRVEATDVSLDALEVAQQNARALISPVTFIHGDGTNALSGTYDVIISNPPYIAHDEKKVMSKSAIQYEPHLALFAEEEGLAFYRHLAETAHFYVKEGSLLVVEIGYAQKEAVCTMFQRAWPHATVRAHRDIYGHDRWIAVHF